MRNNSWGVSKSCNEISNEIWFRNYNEESSITSIYLKVLKTNDVYLHVHTTDREISNFAQTIAAGRVTVTEQQIGLCLCCSYLYQLTISIARLDNIDSILTKLDKEFPGNNISEVKDKMLKYCRSGYEIDTNISEPIAEVAAKSC